MGDLLGALASSPNVCSMQVFASAERIGRAESASIVWLFAQPDLRYARVTAVDDQGIWTRSRSVVTRRDVNETGSDRGEC